MTSDLSRHAATSPDDYTLTVDDALIRYERAGHPRTPRTIQRYCANRHLDCLRKETPFGDKYLITETSVARHLAQIEELAAASRDLSRQVAPLAPLIFRSDSPRHEAATAADQSRPAAATVGAKESHEDSKSESTTSRDLSRQVATDDRYVGQLEKENEFLRAQITTKDMQIKELTERSRETNVLIGGLQRLLAPLLGSRDPYPQEGEGKSI
jgi:hypothetical protein